MAEGAELLLLLKSFVQGVDILPNSLTVSEVLWYTTTTRLPHMKESLQKQTVESEFRICLILFT